MKPIGTIQIVVMENGDVQVMSQLDALSTMRVLGIAMAKLADAFRKAEEQKIQPASVIPQIVKPGRN
jgi:hypothetical protein